MTDSISETSRNKDMTSINEADHCHFFPLFLQNSSASVASAGRSMNASALCLTTGHTSRARKPFKWSEEGGGLTVVWPNAGPGRLRLEDS